MLLILLFYLYLYIYLLLYILIFKNNLGYQHRFFNYHDNSINYYYVNFNLIRRLWFLMFIYLLLIIGN